MTIDDKSHFCHAVETKKITLLFPNGGRVVLNPNMKNTDDVWKACESVLIEQWLTKEEFKKLYPDLKIK